jgi:hypothetical protein
MITTTNADQHDQAPTSQAPRQRRAWPVLLLALPAFVAIWSGWVELGRLTGFGPVSPLPGIWDSARIDTAITLPIGVETYAAYALHVWLAEQVSDRARRFARVSAIGSLILGAGGQVAYHLMAAAGVERAPWQITALVACLPVAVLGMGAALAHLVAEPIDQGDPDEIAEHDRGVAEHLDYLDRMDALRASGADAEAWTRSAVIMNALREHDQNGPDAIADAGHLDIVPSNIDQAPDTVRPAPVDQARSTARTTGRTSGRSNAEKARALREKHPDWTVARIAERVGVTERTARRYFTATPAALIEAAPPELAGPAASGDLAA